jgi:peptide/nickel transport system permease protein
MAAGIFVEVVLGLMLGVPPPSPRRLCRSRRDDGVLRRRVRAAVRRRPAAALRLRRHARLVSDERLRHLAHVVLPATTLGILGAGWYARMVRSAMIDVLNQDYVRTARAKGLSSGAASSFRHALPNAILPIIAMIGIDIGQFMSGVVVVEAVYGWPGIGQLAWQAIQQVDIPIIMGVTLVSALAIVIGNLVADLIAPLIDPRIRTH